MISFARSDGSVDFRDRAMQSIQREQSTDVLSSLVQLGYTFPAYNPGRLYAPLPYSMRADTV